jgi:hypothetical protein
MHDYAVEFDVPYTECEEVGWSKLRLLRDLPGAVHISSFLKFERATGTLMLQPLERHTVEHQATRIPATGWVMGAPTGWAEHHRLDGPTILRSKLRPGTLIDTLLLVAENAVELAIAAQTMIPVLATDEVFTANQALWFELELSGPPNTAAQNIFALIFGDFCLVVHQFGRADLYWSSDNSRDADSWVWRKQFAAEPTGQGSHMSSWVMGVPAGPGSSAYGYVMPFGRGNILVSMQTGGMNFQGVYRHPEAAWNAGTEVYEITKAGTAILYLDGADNAAYNIGVNLGKLPFASSGTWDDELWEMPYSPTVIPTSALHWCKTQGAPTAELILNNEEGGLFVADGAHNKVRPRIELTGDGTTSPWVSSYIFRFDPKIKAYTPTPFSLPIKDLQLTDGEGWDDQHADVTLEDDGLDPNLRNLMFRSEINGRLKIDGEPRAVYLFKRPEVDLNKARTTTGGQKKWKATVKLSGKNFGIVRLQEKRFMFPKSYGNMTAPNAVADLLTVAGFSPADIIIDADPAVILPATTLQGEDTAKGGQKPEIKSQPQFNSSVEQFLGWIREEFEPWPLIFGGDMKWRFQRPIVPTVGVASFASDGPRTGIWAPWFEEPSFAVDPPECNLLYLIGQQDDGEVIGNTAVDWPSVGPPSGHKPLNYLGRIRHVVLIDPAINDPDMLDRCLNVAFERLRRAIIQVSWKGPFLPNLHINDAVDLDGFAVVQIKRVETKADSPTKLEHTASTSYSGILLRPLTTWLPTPRPYITTEGRFRGERDRLMHIISRRANDQGGKDIHVRSETTAQQNDPEELLKEIMRGNVLWGTPIELT